MLPMEKLLIVATVTNYQKQPLRQERTKQKKLPKHLNGIR